MKYRSWAEHVRRLVGAAVVTAVLAGTAAPAFAADSTPTPPPPSSLSATTPTTPTATATVATRTSAEIFTDALAAVPPATVATTAPTTPSRAQSNDGFFRTRTGVAVLAIFAVGTGYAIYSAKEDRIHGRNR